MTTDLLATPGFVWICNTKCTSDPAVATADASPAGHRASAAKSTPRNIPGAMANAIHALPQKLFTTPPPSSPATQRGTRQEPRYLPQIRGSGFNGLSSRSTGLHQSVNIRTTSLHRTVGG